jgi:hypothetical protein
MASLALAAALLVFGRLDGLPHVLMVPRFDSFSHSAWIKKKRAGSFRFLPSCLYGTNPIAHLTSLAL